MDTCLSHNTELVYVLHESLLILIKPTMSFMLIQASFSNPVLKKIFMCFGLFFQRVFQSAESYSVQKNSSKELT